MKPLLDKKTYNMLRKASYANMLAFVLTLYKQGFEDGANSTTEEGVKYIKVKEDVDYICENCNAKLELYDMEE